MKHNRSMRAAAGLLRRGFTITEMLVVIAIIALMASLLLPALSAVRRYVKRSETTSEIHKIGMALATFKDQTGAYPVDAQFAGDPVNAPNIDVADYAAGLPSNTLVAALEAKQYYSFPAARLGANGFYDYFEGYYRYDVIKNGHGFIILSAGRNGVFDGFANLNSDDLSNVDVKSTAPADF